MKRDPGYRMSLQNIIHTPKLTPGEKVEQVLRLTDQEVARWLDEVGARALSVEARNGAWRPPRYPVE